MRVVFIGGLPHGREILKTLLDNKQTELLKAFVLKDDCSVKVPDFVKFDDILTDTRLTKVSRIGDHAEQIIVLKPDIIVVVGWSQLISQAVIDSAKVGVIGFHPAKLPKDRGRSVLAWQISEGYTKGAVTMFWIDEGVDSGDIIAQEEYDIEYEDTIREVLDKVYSISAKLFKTGYPIIASGIRAGTLQDHSQATYRSLRTKENGEIKWDSSSREIYNLVRAISHPYPGAHTFYKGIELKIIKVLEAPLVQEQYAGIRPGTIIDVMYDGRVTVKTGDNAVIIKDFIPGDKEVYADKLKNIIFEVGTVLGGGNNI